jgi:hypothetical protein
MSKASASSQAWRGPAPPKAIRVKLLGSWPRSRLITRMARTILEFATRTIPSAASRGFNLIFLASERKGARIFFRWSFIFPPKKYSGGILPKSTWASVRVISRPP